MAEVFARTGLQVSTEKTKIIISRGEEGQPVEVDRVRIAAMKKFEYLGNVQGEDGTSEKAVQHRIAKASGAFYALGHLWKDPLGPLLKGKLYVTMVRSVLLYGAGTWTLSEEEARSLENFDMMCIRSILKVSKIEHRTSVQLRRWLGIETDIITEVVRARLRLYGHVVRRTESYAAQLVDVGMKRKYGRVGRPKLTWLHGVEHSLKLRGTGLKQAKGVAMRCRDRYRKKVVFAKVLT